MLPSGETNLGEPNGEISISNSVAANLWYQLRQAYSHNHTICDYDYKFAAAANLWCQD